MKLKNDFIWSVLAHLSTNMWFEESDTQCKGSDLWQIPASYSMRFDRTVWNNYVSELKDSGANTIVLELGDGVIYDSHPEIAVKGAWTKAELSDELARLNNMGFEVIPKLNFSATHDAWMKDYSRMVSTPTYYQFCDDLIDEVSELFKPRYFHIGMDEEVYENQATYNYVVLRQNELWWHDLYRVVNRIEKNGARAMMWSDYARHRPEEFVEKCPKSVVQCVWYYWCEFEGQLEEKHIIRLKPYELFDKHGFDQIPGGSMCYFRDNFALLAKYCKEHISKEHLLGLMQTSWATVTPQEADKLHTSTETIKAAKEIYKKA